MPPVPPPRLRPRRAKAPLGAAQRRRTPSSLTPGKVVARGSTPPKPPAVKPGPVLKRENQPRSSDNGDRLTPTRTNTGSPETRATGYGADRVGKQFTVKYLGNGRVAHLYGNDVPADQRRQVFKRAARRRAG